MCVNFEVSNANIPGITDINVKKKKDKKGYHMENTRNIVHVTDVYICMHLHVKFQVSKTYTAVHVFQELLT